MRVRTRIIAAVGAGSAITVLAAGPAMASTHTVQAGETLSGIAAQSGESLARVEADNPQITNPNVITVGELVHMWGGTGTLAPLRTKSDSTKASTSQGSTSQGSTAQASDSQASPTQSSDSQSSSTAAGTSSGAAPSSFQQCVAWRESSNTPTDPDGLYGILPSTWQSLGYSGTAGQASVAQQNEAFNRLYAQYGTSPWSSYDGC